MIVPYTILAQIVFGDYITFSCRPPYVYVLCSYFCRPEFYCIMCDLYQLIAIFIFRLILVHYLMLNLQKLLMKSMAYQIQFLLNHWIYRIVSLLNIKTRRSKKYKTSKIDLKFMKHESIFTANAFSVTCYFSYL